ncbi:uncharacterized protein LOC135171474 [Diachasmimorpha longicaudata]|uniref:uncharacterized protein LOC135171474 n=1 Tax=Diachasmimorpha longicaudata TaxID=58733 RepID=UPI0030B8B0C5
MAIRTSSSLSDIPKEAVVVDENDAINHQWETIKSWPKLAEVWPFRIGIPLLGAAGTIGGLVINTHFRRKLSLYSYGKLATTVAMGMAPAVMIAGSHAIFVTHDLYLNKTQCLVCLQQKAILLQLTFGLGYPLTLSPLANFMYATRHGTYRLPYWGDYKGTIKLWWKWIVSAREKFLLLILFHAFTAAFLTYKEKESLLNVQQKLLTVEAEYLEELKSRGKGGSPGGGTPQ